MKPAEHLLTIDSASLLLAVAFSAINSIFINSQQLFSASKTNIAGGNKFIQLMFES